MREDSRDYGVINDLHWHDGSTCHGSPTLQGCQTEAISKGWTGKILEREDAYRGGAKVKCYSMIAYGFDHYAKQGKFVAEVKLVAVPIKQDEPEPET